MKLKPYYLGLVLLIVLTLTASSAFGVGGAGTVTGGTFPACVDPANTNTSTVKIAGKVVAPGGLVRVPTGTTCLASETTLNLNSYVKTVLVSPGANNVTNGNNLRTAINNALAGTLVKVEPGTYDLAITPLTMKTGVVLEGSGEGLTTITSQVSSNTSPPTSGTVVLASNSEIRFLTIANTVSATNNVVVYAAWVDKTAKLTNVTLTSSGTGNYNYDISNFFSSPTILNSTLTATGNNINYGIDNYNYSPTILNSTITINGNNINYGINNYNASPTIQNSTIAISGSGINYGSQNSSRANPIILFSTITTNGGNQNYSISSDFSFPTIQSSTITATGGSSNISIANLDASTAKVGNSLLGASISGTGFSCVASYDANFVALNGTCQ